MQPSCYSSSPHSGTYSMLDQRQQTELLIDNKATPMASPSVNDSAANTTIKAFISHRPEQFFNMVEAFESGDNVIFQLTYYTHRRL